MENMLLTPVQVWDVSEKAFHNAKYRDTYVKTLSKIIDDRNKAILDTACGTGFPSIDLFKKGYNNIKCCDADEKEIKILKKRLEENGIKLPIINTTWQNINNEITTKFDVVLNMDNSLPYMDSWYGEPPYKGREIFDRLMLVIGNFRRLLKEDGILIIAVAKNNMKENSKLKINFDRIKTDRKNTDVIWEIKFDWKNRIKICKIKIVIGKEVSERVVKSYLYTKEELKNIIIKFGFKNIEIIDVKGLYDNILICSV